MNVFIVQSPMKCEMLKTHHWEKVEDYATASRMRYEYIMRTLDEAIMHICAGNKGHCVPLCVLGVTKHKNTLQRG